MLAVTEVKVETIVVGNSSSGKVPRHTSSVLCFLFPCRQASRIFLYTLEKMIHQVVSLVAVTNWRESSFEIKILRLCESLNLTSSLTWCAQILLPQFWLWLPAQLCSLSIPFTRSGVVLMCSSNPVQFSYINLKPTSALDAAALRLWGNENMGKREGVVWYQSLLKCSCAIYLP